MEPLKYFIQHSCNLALNGLSGMRTLTLIVSGPLFPSGLTGERPPLLK
jgi:hypothetical protein